MDRKNLILLVLALIGSTTAWSQTETLNYIGGDMIGSVVGTQYFGESPFAPPPSSSTVQINGNIVGSLTLSTPLPSTGTLTVDPADILNVNLQGTFSPGLIGTSPYDTSFTFTTIDGAIVGWDVLYNYCPCYGQQSFTLSSSGGDSYEVATNLAPDSAGDGITYTGGASGPSGTWSFAAPEIDPSSAVSAIALLFGGLAVVRGRKSNTGFSKIFTRAC